jgi:hypothetical protein
MRHVHRSTILTPCDTALQSILQSILPHFFFISHPHPLHLAVYLTPPRTCTIGVVNSMIFKGISLPANNCLTHVARCMQDTFEYNNPQSIIVFLPCSHFTCLSPSTLLVLHLVRSLFPLAFGSALHTHEPPAPFHHFGPPTRS